MPDWYALQPAGVVALDENQEAHHLDRQGRRDFQVEGPQGGDWVG